MTSVADPEIVLFGGTLASASAECMAGSPASGGDGRSGGDPRRAADIDAVAHVTDELTAPEEENGPQISSPRSPEKRKNKQQRKGKNPEVVEGDDLANTPKMIALVWSTLALNLAYLLQVNGRAPNPFFSFLAWRYGTEYTPAILW